MLAQSLSSSLSGMTAGLKFIPENGGGAGIRLQSRVGSDG